MIAHRTVEVDGLSVFYREAGDPANPKLLLLGGFPASSHQFRNLIPALADRFHVLSPDYPGFGNTDMPEDFEYTFDRLSEVVEGLLEQTGFHPFGLYHQDYGGPIGNRIVGRHPDWLEWQVIQNSNAYEEGFTAAWDGIRHALWVDRSPETEAPLLPFLELDGVQAHLPARPSRPGADQPGQLEHGRPLPRAGPVRARPSSICCTTTARTSSCIRSGRRSCASTARRR